MVQSWFSLHFLTPNWAFRKVRALLPEIDLFKGNVQEVMPNGSPLGIPNGSQRHGDGHGDVVESMEKSLDVLRFS